MDHLIVIEKVKGLPLTKNQSNLQYGFTLITVEGKAFYNFSNRILGNFLMTNLTFTVWYNRKIWVNQCTYAT